MIVDQRVTIPAPVDRVWKFVMNVPAVSRCVPGVESVTEIDDTTYEGALRVKVGPISVRLEGRVLLAEQDAAAHRARMDLNAVDRRVNGAVNAKMTMTLESRDDGQTDMAVHTDASIMGKLGEFGQAVMRKKAEQIMAEFARNLSDEVSK